MKSNSMPKKREKIAISHIRKKLLRWQSHHGRNYPWRESVDPFRVLMAEIMLIRTKPEQVVRVYDKLFTNYPDFSSLKLATTEEIDEIVKSLGLNWRSSVFSIILKEMKDRFHGRVPDSRKDLKSLTGVGDYVAGAVLSIAFNRKEWMVDVNIGRAIKRYFGIKTGKETRRNRRIIEVAKLYAQCSTPGLANLAILDFSTLICKSGNPGCTICPISHGCRFLKSQSGLAKVS